MSHLRRLRCARTASPKIPDWQYQPLPSQVRFHSSPSRFKGYSGPIGSGKSYALVYEALFLSDINAGLTGLLGAPTFPMLRDSTQTAFFEIVEAEDIPYTFNKTENRVSFPESGSQILFRSLDKFERLRGTNLAWCGIDEMTRRPVDQATPNRGWAFKGCGCGVLWTRVGRALQVEVYGEGAAGCLEGCCAHDAGPRVGGAARAAR